MSLKLNSEAKLSYILSVIRGGREILVQPRRDNMITDVGLDSVAVTSWANLIGVLMVGNAPSPTPVRRDTGTATITQSGYVLTCSGNFFVAADVGRKIKLNDPSGTEYYITGYTDAKNVTVSHAASIVTGYTATVWYVNRTAMDAYVCGGNTYGTAGGDNGTTWSGSKQTIKRTVITSPIPSNTTITEVAFAQNNSNVNVFDLDNVLGGLAVYAGDCVKAVVTIEVTHSPTTPLAVGNVGVGADTSGFFQIERGSQFASVDSGGGSHGRFGPWYDYVYWGICLLFNDFSLQTFDQAADGIVGSYSQKAITRAGYTSGSFTRDVYASWGLAEGNGVIYGIGFCDMGGSRWAAQKFATPFEKTSSQTLAVTFTYSWGRALVN